MRCRLKNGWSRQSKVLRPLHAQRPLLFCLRVIPDVIVSDIDAKQGEATAQGIRDAGGDARFAACNVADVEQVKALIAGIEANCGRLDCAFNNAGIEIEQGKLFDGDEDVFDRIMDVSVKGVWQRMRFQVPLMLKNDGGSTVNTASVAALVAALKMSIYAPVSTLYSV